MATVSITNQTLTLTIDIDGLETVIRKDNAKVQAFGDYVRITDYANNRYEFLYSDCTDPSEASANDLRDAIEVFLNTAGGGGGGGAFTDLTDTFASYSGKAGQALVVNDAETGVESASMIPLAGTETGAPLTGVIEVQSGALARWNDSETIYKQIGINGDAEFTIEQRDTDINAFGLVAAALSGVTIALSNGTTGGFFGLTNNAGVIEASISAEKFAIFGNTAVPKASAIPDATDLSSAITAVNSMLAALRAYGFIAV